MLTAVLTAVLTSTQLPHQPGFRGEGASLTHIVPGTLGSQIRSSCPGGGAAAAGSLPHAHARP
jgi:hypothetical protein